MGEISPLDVFFKPKVWPLLERPLIPRSRAILRSKTLCPWATRERSSRQSAREFHPRFPCYKSILDIPEPVEAAFCWYLRISRCRLRKNSHKGKASSMTCWSCLHVSGFWRTRHQRWKAARKELVQTLRSASIRLIGPNCVGMIDAYSGFNTSFDIPSYPKGGLSFLTQSGALATSFLFWAGGLRLSD